GVALASAVSWSFTTVNSAPTVTANTPANNARSEERRVGKEGTFSRAMDATKITNASFTLTPQGGSAVAATVGYSGTTATLTPTAPLPHTTANTARRTTAGKAADGVALASAVSWSFTTVNSAPTVTANTPANNA